MDFQRLPLSDCCVVTVVLSYRKFAYINVTLVRCMFANRCTQCRHLLATFAVDARSAVENTYV